MYPQRFNLSGLQREQLALANRTVTPTQAGIVIILALRYALDIAIACGFTGVEDVLAGLHASPRCGTCCFGRTGIAHTQNQHRQDDGWERIILDSHFQLLR